jgi:thymidine phosphorylase
MIYQEIVVFTKEIIVTRETFQFPQMTKSTVNHEPTGHVGDETKLILIFLILLITAYGIDMPSMIGKEDNFDIHDLNKWCTIAGLQTNLSHDQFVK